jgi:D-alanine transaminase
MARQHAAEAGCREVWHVDAEGLVTEGAGSNAFIVDGAARLVTRPLGHEILGGVTREVVLELARREGIGVVERPFTVEEALSAREAFLTSTSSLVLPVTRIDGHPVGDGRPGRVTATLLQRYRERM